jgi:hypothetical protein
MGKVPSFNFDLSGLLSTAASFFNAFGPLFLTIAGIGVGFGLIAKVASEVRKLF